MFPFQRTTNRIGNLTRLIYTQLEVITIHSIVHSIQYRSKSTLWLRIVQYIVYSTLLCDVIRYRLVRSCAVPGGDTHSVMCNLINTHTHIHTHTL